MATPQKLSKEERLARGLGWLSLGVGMAELVAPRRFAAAIGVDDDLRTRVTLRLMGLRELASGVGLLKSPRPGAFAWSRVGGDVVDLALLGSAMASRRRHTMRLVSAVGAVTGIGLIDALAARRLGGSGRARTDAGREEVVRAITIARPADEIYGLWRQLENLPRFMGHVSEVKVLGGRRSHWIVEGPARTTIEWDAEITEDVPGELLAWKSLPGSPVDTEGEVRLRPAPGRLATEVVVRLRYTAPGGKVGVLVAKLLGDEPGQEIARDLARLKQVLEIGEVMKSDASIHEDLHPAQPSRAVAPEAQP